jgi:hypothetical protein
MTSFIEAFMAEKRSYRQRPREFKEEASALSGNEVWAGDITYGRCPVSAGQNTARWSAPCYFATGTMLNCSTLLIVTVSIPFIVGMFD